MAHAPDDSLTRPSLIARVATSSTDQEAWREFVGRYAPRILAWARALGLQEADAEDVAAAVLQRLATAMTRFVYDPSRSFRGWLRTLTRNAWADLVAARRIAGPSPLDGDALERVEAREDLVRRLEREFDLELLEEATRRVRRRVAPTTWEAYRLTAVDGLPGAEVASRLGMKASAVFVAKSSVLSRIRDEVRALESIGARSAPRPG